MMNGRRFYTWIGLLLTIALLAAFAVGPEAFAADGAENAGPVAAEQENDVPEEEEAAGPESEDAPGEAAETLPEEEAPPTCSLTGEHVFGEYVFTGEGTHQALCTLCGETFENACEYPEPAEYRSKDDGTHSECCMLCGGEKISDCSMVDTVVPPTQTTAGYTEHVCSLCGYTTVSDEKEQEKDRAESRLLGDVDNSGGVEASDARTILRYVVSLDNLSPENIVFCDLDLSGGIDSGDARLALRTSVSLEESVRHDFSVTVNKVATCTAGGVQTCLCQYCGETKEMNVRALGHRNGKPTVKPATCTKAGSAVYVCTVCKHKETVKLPATGHDFEQVLVPATCTENGSDTQTCKNCGKTSVTVLKAPGHQWINATATTPKRCERCGEIVAGWTAVDGKYYYFNEDGSRAVNQIVDNKYVDETGVRIDNSKAINLAVKFVKDHGGNGDAATKLHNCFEYLARYYPYTTLRIVIPNESTLPTVAYNMFTNKTGNCFSYAAAFAYIAKVLGYESRVQCGQIIAWGGNYYVAHGWTEVKVDGTWYICDAQQSYHRDRYDRYMKTRANFNIPLKSGSVYTLTAKDGSVKFV